MFKKFSKEKNMHLLIQHSPAPPYFSCENSIGKLLSKPINCFSLKNWQWNGTKSTKNKWSQWKFEIKKWPSGTSSSCQFRVCEFSSNWFWVVFMRDGYRYRWWLDRMPTTTPPKIRAFKKLLNPTVMTVFIRNGYRHRW